MGTGTNTAPFPFLSLSGLGNLGAHVRSAGAMVTRLPHSLPLPEDLVGSFPPPSLQQPRDSRRFTPLAKAGIEPTGLRNPSIASSGRPRSYSLTSSCALPACLEPELEVQRAQLTTHCQQRKLPRSLSSHHAPLYRTVPLPGRQLQGRAAPASSIPPSIEPSWCCLQGAELALSCAFTGT